LPDTAESPRPRAVRARHAASLIVLRGPAEAPEMLMGLRGAGHRFNPNRLVFPGGAVDRADLDARAATPLSERTTWALCKAANPRLAHGIGIAAARELLEETGLTLGSPPRLDGLVYLMRAVTPLHRPIRFNARFLLVNADQVSGEIAGDGELEHIRYYGLAEVLAMDLAVPTRRVLEQLQTWLAMSEADRAAMTHTPVLRTREPRLWRE
jgi:8-oxo-dGTP pyrophosphatase MutT (NUDIX family)